MRKVTLEGKIHYSITVTMDEGVNVVEVEDHILGLITDPPNSYDGGFDVEDCDILNHSIEVEDSR